MAANAVRSVEMKIAVPSETPESRRGARRRLAEISSALALSTTLVAGCGGVDMGRWLPSWGERSGGEAPRTPAGAKAYACEGGKRLLVRYSADNRYATVIFPEREFRLDADASAPGAKFSNGRTVLVVKGDDAALDDGGTAVFAKCRIEAASQ